MEEKIEYDETKERQRVIQGLIEASGKDAITPIFEPLNASFMVSLTFFNNRGSMFAMEVTRRLKDKPGMSAIQSMEKFPKKYQGAQVVGQPIAFKEYLVIVMLG